MPTFTRAFRYWFTAILKPRFVFERFRQDPDRFSISLWILILFSAMYTITAFIFAVVGRQPALEPWMPIPMDQYYFYQTFWTVPWGLATGIMMAGIAYVIAAAGRKEAGFTFEGALAVISVAWVVPSFILMWLPETFIAPFFDGLPWPAWLEVIRLSVLAPIWQVALTAVGVRITYGTGWARASLIGLVTTAVSFLMFLPFMR